MTQIRKNNVDDAIKVINEAIYDACENNLNYVKVEVPCTGKKTCKAIRDHFEAEGWTVKKEGKVVEENKEAELQDAEIKTIDEQPKEVKQEEKETVNEEQL